ncbi:MAG: DsbA family protein [Pseudomonadota bacterium]
MNRLGRVSVSILLLFGAIACSAAESGSDEKKGSSGVADQSSTSITDGDSTSSPNSIAKTDMTLGAEDAPLTLIEYASLTCPACANFHENVYPTIKEKFIDTGQVRFVFREFPTAPVDFSLIGSVLARCAAEEVGSDGYFLLLKALFKNQRTWIYGEDPKLELLKIAGQAGMDEAAFDACLKERQDLVDLIRDNAEAGSEAFDITGTPTLVLNGEKIKYGSVDELVEQIETAVTAANDADADDGSNG